MGLQHRRSGLRSRFPAASASAPMVLRDRCGEGQASHVRHATEVSTQMRNGVTGSCRGRFLRAQRGLELPSGLM